MIDVFGVRGGRTGANSVANRSLSPLFARHPSRLSFVQCSPLLHHNKRIKKLADQEHFHYAAVELGPVEVKLISIDLKSVDKRMCLEIDSNSRKWRIDRTFTQLVEFDCQLHRCVFDRSHSRLAELGEIAHTSKDLCEEIEKYLARLSQITGSLIRCFPVLKFLEVDSRGNHFLLAEDTPINTPAIATAIVTKQFDAQSSDQLSLKVGDIVSVIEKTLPQKNGVSWWKAKLTITNDNNEGATNDHYFEVGLFPSECVKLFDGKSELGPNEGLSHAMEQASRHKPRSVVPNLLKRSTTRCEPVFGIDLVEYLRRTGEEVPPILRHCAELIEEHGIVTGVYRQCGIQSNIKKLRHCFDSGHIPDLNDETVLRDIHCVSSLLKQYFRQLPNPLFTFQLYPDFIAAYEVRDETRRNQFKEVIDRLPPEHYRTARYLVQHLSRLCQHTNLTDMNARNLAIVWAPNLFRNPPCLSGREPHLLQGLNVQTGLCNFVLLNASYLFSFNSGSGSLPTHKENDGVFMSSTRISESPGSSDLSTRNCINVNGGPASIPLFHTVLDRPSRKSTSHTGTLGRMLRGPSADHAFSSLRRRCRFLEDQQAADEVNSDTIKWRRDTCNERMAAFRAARSTSLISFVTKSVEEFRNGVVRSWRVRTSGSKHAKDKTGLRGSPSTKEIYPDYETLHDVSSCPNSFEQQPSTSAEARTSETLTGSESEKNSVSTSGRKFDGSSLICHRSTPEDIDNNECRALESRKQPGKCRDKKYVCLASKKDLNQTVKDDSFDSSGDLNLKNGRGDETEKELTGSLAEWSDSASTDSSVQLDMSRYDNVSPLFGTGGRAEKGGKNESLCDMFRNGRQCHHRPRSNIQLYFF